MTGGLIRRPISRGDLGRLGLGPLLYAAGILLWWVSDRLVGIGPFDRAQVGWVAVIPAVALAPALAGLAEATPHITRTARRLTLAVAAATGLGVGWWIATNTVQIGCRPITSPIDVLPQAIVTGVLAGLAYAGAYVVSAAQASSGHPVAGVVAGSVTWLVIAGTDVFLVFVVLFPPLTCAFPTV